MRVRSRRPTVMALAALLAAPIGGCATLQEVAALRAVRFTLDRVDAVRVAGVAIDGRRGFYDLEAGEAGRLAAAAVAGRMPLEMTLHVRAENPAENRVTARLVAMDWTLFLDDRETIAGRLTEPHAFPPGEPVDVPLAVELDLLEFFRANARDAYELVLSLAGYGGEPREVRLEALPTIETSLGPIRYPRPIVIRREVGTR